jgi:multiple sugar transport system substrate-binding protein
MTRWVAGAVFVAVVLLVAWLAQPSPSVLIPADRSLVVFWHFWGGQDRQVVEDVVRRFNNAQSRYFVRAIAVPGNNLDAKLFLSIAGGDAPDLVNQDDPIVGEWAARGVIRPLDECAPADEVERLDQWLFPAARRLGRFNEQTYAVCNALDIRALYYNGTMLQQYGLQPPTTLADLDEIARRIAPPGADKSWPAAFGFLPDPRRLWAWGVVFGGRLYDDTTARVTVDEPEVVAALAWMQQYSRWYGADTVAAFRSGDQSLPGKTFPLLPASDDQMHGRYAVVMDGQWRTRDLAAFTEARNRRGIVAPEFGVCPLPPPPGGRSDAGWVNGNVFVVPRNAANPRGAWEFIKFWIGLDDPSAAAVTCAAGGWIPVSPSVAAAPEFQEFFQRQPLFGEFVRLAASPHQEPLPVIPGAAYFRRAVDQLGERAMRDETVDVGQLARETAWDVQRRLDELTVEFRERD